VLLITAALAIGLKTAPGHSPDEQAWATSPSSGMAGQNGREPDNGQKYRHWKDVIASKTRTGQGKALNGENTNGTGAVWLKRIRDRGTNVVVEGMAVSPAAVDEMISNLQGTGSFSNIEIEETYQDDSKNKGQAFKFQLICNIR
jgi:hypothetical protein